MSGDVSRPRGYLAQTLYEKYNNDVFIDNYDYSLWYKLPNDGKEIEEKYRIKFFDLQEPDFETMQWISESKAKSSNMALQIWHIVAKLFLKIFLTQTCSNGLLRRGSMFILSEKQFSQFLFRGGLNFGNETMINMLDIGAGDGKITMRLAKSLLQLNNKIILNVFASETSYIMKDRLRELDITVIDDIQMINNVHLISCLNVLDRCVDPKSLLTDIYNSLHPNGRALFALVLPYNHYVERSSSHLPLNPLMNHWPNKTLPFNEEINVFFEQLEQIGFRIESFTKAGYLCEGDIRQSFYWLIDILVIVSKA